MQVAQICAWPVRCQRGGRAARGSGGRGHRQYHQGCGRRAYDADPNDA